MKRYTVMRGPCFMEDEGRHLYIGTYNTKEEAQNWISDQEGEFFTPGDYYITEATLFG